jgi:hypothetical protein
MSDYSIRNLLQNAESLVREAEFKEKDYERLRMLQKLQEEIALVHDVYTELGVD